MQWLSFIIHNNAEGGCTRLALGLNFIYFVWSVGAMPSMPEASLPRDNPSVLGEDTAGSTANIPSKTPARVQEGPATSVQGRGHSLIQYL